MEMEKDNIEMEEDHIPGHENMSKYYFEKTQNCVIS